MDEIAKTAEDDFSLLSFAQRMALQWGKADLLAVGPDPTLARVSELAAYFAVFGDEKGNQVADAVWVMLSPMPAGGEGAALAMLREGFGAAIGALSEGKATAEWIDDAFAFLSTRFVPTFDGDNLVELLSGAPPKTAIIIAEAGQYRLASTEMKKGVHVEESVRSAHMHQLLVEVDQLCRAGGCYITLDFGFYAPSGKSDLELLQSVGDTGIVAGGVMDIDPGAIVAKISRWHDNARAGEIGAVIKEIEADAGFSEKQKFFMKLEAYSTAGLHDMVRVLLNKQPGILAGVTPDQSLHIARICESAGDDDRAEALILGALPDLRSETDFGNALSTALKLRNRSIRTAVATAFVSFFPNSPVLRRYATLTAARAGEYAEAADLLRRSSDPEASATAGYYDLLAARTATSDFDARRVHAEIAATFPDYASDCALEITHILEREGGRMECLPFLLARAGSATSGEVTRLIRLTGLALQAGELRSDDDIMEHIVDRAIAFLATHPDDGIVRTRLATLLGPALTAESGLMIMVAAVLKRAQALPSIRPRPKVNDRPRPMAPEEAQPWLEKIWHWLRERGDGMWLVGRHVLPASELDVSPEELIAAILVQTDFMGDRLADDADQAALTLCVAAASAIAPLSPEPDEDLTVVRTAGSKLAIAGKGQAARDIAEFALANAGTRVERHRQALFTFADIYSRLGMTIEALVTLAATLETAADVSWDQIWFETNLLFRLLRDVGLAELALPFLERSREALDALGLQERDGFRLETMAIQAAVAGFSTSHGSNEELAELVGRATANVAQVLDRHDDVLPIAMVLNALLEETRSRQMAEASALEALMAHVLTALPTPQQQMIRAAGPAPALTDIAAVAAAIDEPRYADDAGYDLRHVRLMSRKLVQGAIDDVDPETLTYAIEASADRAISVKTTAGEKVVTQRLLSSEDGPLRAAEAMSGQGVDIVGLALFDNNLASITFSAGSVSEIAVEAPETFSLAALEKWQLRFPKDYSLEDKDLSRDQVRGSVLGLGLTNLTKRTVLIADARLQRFPPNLLTIDGNFAGFERAIAISPSLEWLTASRTLDRQGDGSALMWIPSSSAAAEPGPLSFMAEELEAVLDAHHVALERGSAPSSQFRKADVAIIAAHGGLADVNRYFRSVSNDDHIVTEISDVAEVTRMARITILFICSGGRIDPHPETGMAIGLAKQVLARGSTAVIAPAWPIPFFMARPWLDGFLASWNAGAHVLDACFAANMNVAASSSWDPKRTLAMGVYGDPFVRAAGATPPV